MLQGQRNLSPILRAMVHDWPLISVQKATQKIAKVTHSQTEIKLEIMFEIGLAAEPFEII